MILFNDNVMFLIAWYIIMFSLEYLLFIKSIVECTV